MTKTSEQLATRKFRRENYGCSKNVRACHCYLWDSSQHIVIRLIYSNNWNFLLQESGKFSLKTKEYCL